VTLADVRETDFDGARSARHVHSEHSSGSIAATTWIDTRSSAHGSTPKTPQARHPIPQAVLTPAPHCKFSASVRHPVPSRSTPDAELGTRGCGRDGRADLHRSADGGGDHHAASQRASGHDTAPSSTGPHGRSADTRRTPGRSRDRCKPQTAATPSSTSAARGFWTQDAGRASALASTTAPGRPRGSVLQHRASSIPSPPLPSALVSPTRRQVQNSAVRDAH
jgi:hypothetical protein